MIRETTLTEENFTFTSEDAELLKDCIEKLDSNKAIRDKMILTYFDYQKKCYEAMLKIKKPQFKLPDFDKYLFHTLRNTLMQLSPSSLGLDTYTNIEKIRFSFDHKSGHGTIHYDSNGI